MRYIVFLLTLLNLLCFKLFSQDTLLLTSGETVVGEVHQTDSNLIYFKIIKHGDKIKKKLFEKNEVYSINYHDGKKTIIYTQDSSSENYLTADEMYYYILGEQAALKYYKPVLPTIGSVLVGIAGSAKSLEHNMIPDFSGIPVFWGMGISAVYIGMTNLGEPKVNIKKLPVSYNELLKNEYFIAGYQCQAKMKKIKGSIKGSIAGLVAGSVISIIISNN